MIPTKISGKNAGIWPQKLIPTEVAGIPIGEMIPTNSAKNAGIWPQKLIPTKVAGIPIPAGIPANSFSDFGPCSNLLDTTVVYYFR